MIHLCSNVRISAFLVALSGGILGGVGCAVESPDDMDSMSPDKVDRVITAEDTAGLSADHHLTLDLRIESYRIDASVFSTDLRYVDIIDPDSRLLGLEQLLDQITTTSKVARASLESDFSMRVVAGQLKVGEFSTGSVERRTRSPQPSLFGTFDIGVIPTTRSCPVNSEAIVINMDDEDSSNGNGRGGFIGAILSDRNTSFFFCRIDGQLFRPLTTDFTATQNHYAVLKLGGACPNNSLDFARSFDNEDSNNANSSFGNIDPNVSNSNTLLRFCLFRSDAITMSDFPDLGFSYGVFATSTFSRRLASGFVHTDDENGSNANKYLADPAWIVDAQRIVTSGANTTLNLAQVR